jgi:hypothetical protein
MQNFKFIFFSNTNNIHCLQVVISLGVMWLGREMRHSFAHSFELKKVWNFTSTAPIFLHGLDKDSFTFTELLRWKKI